jgi:type II secretory pathway pseudopilin PulG
VTAAPSAAARSRGFTLIETVVFVVVIGIAAVALFRMFALTLPRGTTPGQLAQAAQLAQERMELILGQRDVQGYDNSLAGKLNLDPCNVGAPQVCTNTFGFVVTSSGTGTATGTWVAWNGNPTANYKVVTVTVTLNGTTLATQSAVLSSYLP